MYNSLTIQRLSLTLSSVPVLKRKIGPLSHNLRLMLVFFGTLFVMSFVFLILL